MTDSPLRNLPDGTPEVIARFLTAELADDIPAMADCFRPDAVVLDEGVTYLGRDEIVGWREKAAAAYQYTTAVLGSTAIGADGVKVVEHLEGNFPGGLADLEYLFALRDGRVAALMVLQVG
jgi:hypothetical protein